MRITRAEMFMSIAEIVAKRGTCDRARVGAVLVDNNRVISIGYNGSKPGEGHCDDIGHDMQEGHCVRTTHAEINCLTYYRTHKHIGYTSEGKGLSLYVTHLPCLDCCKAIVHYNLEQSPACEKIATIYYDRDYRLGQVDSRIDLLDIGGVVLVQYSNC